VEIKKFVGLLTVLLGIRTEAQLQKVYMSPPPHIGTAVCTVNDYPYKYPIAELNEYVFISFDDLEGDQKNYYYRIRRFDQNWNPSPLFPSEYIDGYDSDYIEGEQNSQATIQSYTRYFFRLPNANTRITKSGNYLIEILDEDEEPVFNFPLIIYENRVPVSVAVQRALDPAKLRTHQYVHAILDISSFPIADPSSDLTVQILRNENPFDPVSFHAPAFYAGNKLDYHFPQQALFEGGDEFLHFETRDLRGYNAGTDSLRLRELYHAYLTPWRPVAYYRALKDIDGSFVVASLQGRDAHTESDYVRVHFRLPADVVPPDKPIYVTGRFNHWRPSGIHRLRLTEDGKFYETSLLLKQGYYDYYYVGKNGDGSIDWTAVWPSFAETENRYTVLVYYHPPGARHIRIIGMGQGVSRPLK